ncbi:unnamed protein product [Schistocephalus solidus]|uniref:Uncharacterized protein n=1 Tax=Schistocephalus solidus TaxID=70667 RepID=A0A183SGK4_SCHSO|nr:unnamed protein product [Schistocephalus solidus]
MRPSRTYLASIGCITGSPVHVNHPARRYQKRRLNRENQPSGSSVAAAVRRRPRNSCTGARSSQGSPSGECDLSSSPSAPTWDAESSATEDAMDETTVTESTELHEGYASSNHEWDEPDFPATNLPASDGIIADLPPIHPTSSNSSLGFINSGSLGSNSHLLRPRSGMGGPIARPFSIADGGLSLPSPDVGVGSIFQTMPSSMRSKRKVLSPPEQHLEEEFPSAQICTSEESGDPFCPRTLRGQSEGPPEFKRLSATPEAPPRGHYPGRNFNDDSEDVSCLVSSSACHAQSFSIPLKPLPVVRAHIYAPALERARRRWCAVQAPTHLECACIDVCTSHARKAHVWLPWLAVKTTAAASVRSRPATIAVAAARVDLGPWARERRAIYFNGKKQLTGV